MVFSESKENIAYYIVNIWLDGDTVIIGNDGDETDYKIINADRAVELKNIIERYGTKIYYD